MRPDAARGEVEQRGAAEAAGADDQGVGSEEPLLRVLAELVEQQVAAVAEALPIVDGNAPGRRPPR